MTEETKTKQRAGATTNDVDPSRRAIRGRAHVRRLAGCSRSKLNRDINRQALLIEMLPMVKRVALKIREHLPAYVEADDLTANGVLGLIGAVSKFDTSKRVKLETYARHRVRGAILDGLRAADPATRDLRRRNNGIQKLYRELEAKLGRPVQDEEVAAASGMNMGQWHRALDEIQGVGIIFDSRVLSAGPTSLRQPADPELLTHGGDNPFDLCYRREQREILGRALSSLPERERRLISLHSQAGWTMKQIAQLMHVDESRVSQLHSAALVRLKANVNSLLRPPEDQVSKCGNRSMAAAAGAKIL